MFIIKGFTQSPPNSTYRMLVLSLAAACFVLSAYGVVYAVNSGGAWAYSTSSGTWTRVDQHGVCYHTRTTDGATRFIPGGTAGGWASYYNTAPNKQLDNCLYSRYRDGQCTAAGGVVVTAGGQRICRFSTSDGACPSGWAAYGSWRQRVGNTCSGAHASGYRGSTSCLNQKGSSSCNYGACSGASSCTPASQGFISGGHVNNCTYTNETTYLAGGTYGSGWFCTTSSATCSSWSHYLVGCY